MKKPFLREGVDVYIEDDVSDTTTVTFVFLSTRKRIQLRIHNNLVATLPLFNGENSLEDIKEKSNLSKKKLEKFVEHLESNGIVVPQNWFEQLELETNYKTILEKQLYFLLDMLNDPQVVCNVQRKIQKTRVAIIGVGSTGSWMLIELIQMGFQSFKLFDFKDMHDNSISRHAFTDTSEIGKPKSLYYKNIGTQINSNIKIESHQISVKVDTEILGKLSDVDLIINCADEPYIGYTSIFLSRFAVKHDKLLFVAGGFDAHLGCLGELIIPFKTPCSDCYNEYFRESLKDWRPSPHPVKNRIKGFGGLPSLSVFSASTGGLAILRYFINEQEFLKTAGGRGEFKFDDYTIDAFEVNKNPECEICGG